MQANGDTLYAGNGDVLGIVIYELGEGMKTQPRYEAAVKYNGAAVKA